MHQQAAAEQNAFEQLQTRVNEFFVFWTGCAFIGEADLINGQKYAAGPGS